MKVQFLNQTASGKNAWWRYLATMLVMIAGLALINIVIGKLLLPSIKSMLPEKASFGGELMTLIFAGIVFGVALLSFLVGFRWLHQRRAGTLINTTGGFSWRYYWRGFAMWGALVFVGMLITDYEKFQHFISTFNALHFLIMLVVGMVTLGIQSFTEEILFRGYLLQGTSLLFRNAWWPVLINGFLFALVHFGYGISAFISTFAFGMVFSLIVLKQQRIEFAAGAHLVNNLLLTVVFIDLSEAVHSSFSWRIDWLELSIELTMITALYFLIASVPSFRQAKVPA